MADGGRLRIGELSKRVGVSPELLRAWETRYGLVDPERTAGRPAALLRGGRAPRAGDAPPDRRGPLGGGGGAGRARGLGRARRPWRSSSTSSTALSPRSTSPPRRRRSIAPSRSLDLETALGQVILPFLHDLGERWAATERSVGAGALRQQRDRRQAARPRPRLGRRRRPARAARLPAGRAARARAALLRAPPARARVEDRLPGRRDADPRRGGGDRGPVARARGAGRDRRAAVPRCRRRHPRADARRRASRSAARARRRPSPGRWARSSSTATWWPRLAP